MRLDRLVTNVRRLVDAGAHYFISFLIVMTCHYLFMFALRSRHENESTRIHAKTISNSDSDSDVDVVFTILCGFVSWIGTSWGAALGFEILDRLQTTNPSLKKYKLLSSSKDKSFLETAPIVARNELCALVIGFPILIASGCIRPIDPNNFTFAQTLGWILIYVLAYDLVFYFGHRWMHANRRIYRWLHAQHHDTFATCGMSHHYMTFADFSLEVLCPALIPFIMLGARGPAFVAFMAMGGWNGVSVHSGWTFPLTPNPKFHFMHHVHPRYNLGLGPFDILCKTYLAPCTVLKAS